MSQSSDAVEMSVGPDAVSEEGERLLQRIVTILLLVEEVAFLRVSVGTVIVREDVVTHLPIELHHPHVNQLDLTVGRTVEQVVVLEIDLQLLPIVRRIHLTG